MTTTAVQVDVWTLTVITPDSSFGPYVTVHVDERDALDALIENYDPEREFDPIPLNPINYDDWVKTFEAFFALQHVAVDKHRTNAHIVEER